MRRILCLAALAMLVAPAAALANGVTAPDGTLSVRDGDGSMWLAMRGAMIGRLGSGVLEVELPGADRECDGLTVWGAEGSTDWTRQRELGQFVTVCRFSGRGIRFRLTLAGSQIVRVKRGRNLDLSAVGRAVGGIKGAGGLDGLYSVDGAPYESLPDEGSPIRFGE